MYVPAVATVAPLRVACTVLVACCAVPRMALNACSPQPLSLQVGFIAFFWFIMMVAQKTLNFNRR